MRKILQRAHLVVFVGLELGELKNAIEQHYIITQVPLDSSLFSLSSINLQRVDGLSTRIWLVEFLKPRNLFILLRDRRRLE